MSCFFFLFSVICFSDISQKKAPGNKLPAAPPLPGKNGNPTFAAVAAAGYDKSPGEYAAVTTRKAFTKVFIVSGYFEYICVTSGNPCKQ